MLRCTTQRLTRQSVKLQRWSNTCSRCQGELRRPSSLQRTNWWIASSPPIPTASRDESMRKSFPLPRFAQQKCSWFHASTIRPNDDEAKTTASLAQLLERSQSFAKGETVATDPTNIPLWNELLAEWNATLPEIMIDVQPQHPQEVHLLIDSLYDTWCRAHSFPPTAENPNKNASTSLPEYLAPLLPLWLDIYSHIRVGPRALEILQGWTVCFGSHLEFQPGREHYETVLRAFAYSDDPSVVKTGGDVALEIIQLLDELSFLMKPVGITYIWALQCVANATDQDSTGKALQDLMHRAESTVLYGKERPNISVKIWIDTLHAIVAAATRGSTVVDRVSLAPWMEAWADLLTRQDAVEHFQREHNSIPALQAAIQNVFQLYESSPDTKNSVKELRRIVDRSEALQHKLPSSRDLYLLQPNNYVTILKLWRSLPTDDVTIADDLLNRLYDVHDRRRKTMKHKHAQTSFNCLLQACLLAGYYHDVLRIYRVMTTERVPRNATSITTLVEAAAESHDRHLLEKSVRILRKTVKAAHRYARLETRHFTLLLESLVKSYHNRGDELGRDVFNMLVAVAEEEGSGVQVEEQHFANLATLLSRPTTMDAAEKIMDLMESMQNVYGLEPNDEFFSALVAALGRRSSVANAERAQQLWQDLRSRGRVDARVYVAVMYAWINSGHKKFMEKVKRVFEQLLEDPTVKPNKVAYRAMLEALTKEGKEESASKAVELIEEYEMKLAEGLVSDNTPDVKLYTAAMRAVWKSNIHGAPAFVEPLYDRLVSIASAYPDELHLQPDAGALTVVIQTWAGSIDPHKARQALAKWKDMKIQFENGNLRMKPTASAAAAVLHACAFTTDSKGREVRLEAVDTALDVWQDIQELGLINNFLVTNLLRVLGRHVDDYDERFRLATIVFQQACVVGCVSNSVVDALRQYVPTLFRQLPSNKTSKKVELPEHWTRVVAR